METSIRGLGGFILGKGVLMNWQVHVHPWLRVSTWAKS